MNEEIVSFGKFLFYPGRRALFNDDVRVRLGSRAVDILDALVEKPGRIWSKGELIERVWPDSVVEETNLRVHVAALRKVLGDGHGGERFIENVPLRGYCFVADVQRQTANSEDDVAIAPMEFDARGSNLPVLLTPMICREELLASLLLNLPLRRFVTLIGPAGIGKTTLAVAAAHECSKLYVDGVRFIDLATVSHSGRVLETVASALGYSASNHQGPAGLAAFLRKKSILLIFDNCEHVLEVAAPIVESILRHAPNTHVMATSREPLRAEGEWLQRLPSLTIPTAATTLTPAQALTYGAVRLFVERASANSDGFKLDASAIERVAHLCRRLDGIPLAIELAAASMNDFGLSELVRRLDERFSILTRGRRTALARHQTLRAALDWSYDSLPAVEKTSLQRLSLFHGSFTSESAVAMIDCGLGGKFDPLEALSNLVSKSLISVDAADELVHYRLLEMTRAYAFEKALEDGDEQELRRSHAVHCCSLFEQADAEWTGPTSAWLSAYRVRIGDLRDALDWAFSSRGDREIGVHLTSWSLPLWFASSLFNEYRNRVLTALDAEKGLPARKPLHEMRLNEALGHVIFHTQPDAEEMNRAFGRAKQLADSLGSREYQNRASWGLWLSSMLLGAYGQSIAIAQGIGDRARAENDGAALIAHHRLMAIATNLNGQHQLSYEHAIDVRKNVQRTGSGARSSAINFDQRSMATSVLARVAWIQGFPDKAAELAEQAVDEALATKHALSLCFVLTLGAALVPLWRGDEEIGQLYTKMLCEQADDLGLPYWQNNGNCFKVVLNAWGLNARDSKVHVERSLYHKSYGHILWDLLATMHESFVDDTVIRRVELGYANFAAPEVLRVRGLWLMERGDEESLIKAEALFKQSLMIAREQKAASWVLRTATSLAGMWGANGRSTEAIQLLGDVYDGFSEGRDTRDLLKAAAVLDVLR